MIFVDGEVATAWSYDGVGRLASQRLPNGAVTAYGYDGLDRVTAILHKRADGATVSSEGYVYDAGGNLTSKTVDGATTTYAYDAVDQLVRETRPGFDVLYGYDGNGNRLRKITNGEVEDYEYDDGDKLLSRHSPGIAFTYDYDRCGRTVAVHNNYGATTTLAYDYEDRLTLLVGPGVSQSYAYNGADARVSKSGTGGTRTYRRDGVGVTDPVLSDGVGTMVPGISERTSGSTRFSHLDRLGTNAKTTDVGGSVVDSRRYDAFGLPIAVTNPTNSQKGFASAFGIQEDPETGLKLMGHRYYDPGSGRFITRDPIGSGTNWYAYCDNNPLKCADPSGLARVEVKPGDQYYDKINAKIKLLRDNGEIAAAASLEDALTHGKIFVETDSQMIVTNEYGEQTNAGAVTRKDGSITILGRILSTNVDLETTLLHESVHRREKALGIPDNEWDATSTTRDYAKRRAAQEHRRRDHGDEDLYNSIVGNSIAYGAKKKARDQRAVTEYWRRFLSCLP